MWHRGLSLNLVVVLVGCGGSSGGGSTSGGDDGSSTATDSAPSGTLTVGDDDSDADSDGDSASADDSDGDSTGDPPRPVGTVDSTEFVPFDDGTELALEDYFATHWIHGSPASDLNQQFYFASCERDGTRKLYVSMSTGDHEDCAMDDELDRYGRGGCGGALVELDYDATSGQATQAGDTHLLPECIELYGVTASEDCSTLAVLCRRESMATVDSAGEITKNILLTANDPDWMTHPVNTAGDGRRMDEIWMYEWSSGQLDTAADKYVLHRAIGTSYGKYSLVRGGDGTYGVGLRADVFSDDGTMHSADMMMVIDRSTYDYTSRGYDWACGVGHTVTNFMTYNPASEKYAMHCTTDWNDDAIPAGDSYLRLEDGDKDNDGDGINNGYFRHPRYGDGELGGGIMLKPVSDGGFIAAIVGLPDAEDQMATDAAFHDDPVSTSVGVVRFAPDGNVVGEIHWLASDAEGLVSSPQLAPLGEDRFLFGWASMHRFAAYEGDRHMDYKLGLSYHVTEIDDQGELLTEQLDLPPNVGWGEWDEAVPMGPGRVGWVSGVPATVDDEQAAMSGFPLDRNRLTAHVYTSSGF